MNDTCNTLISRVNKRMTTSVCDYRCGVCNSCMIFTSDNNYAFHFLHISQPPSPHLDYVHPVPLEYVQTLQIKSIQQLSVQPPANTDTEQYISFFFSPRIRSGASDPLC